MAAGDTAVEKVVHEYAADVGTPADVAGVSADDVAVVVVVDAA